MAGYSPCKGPFEFHGPTLKLAVMKPDNHPFAFYDKGCAPTPTYSTVEVTTRASGGTIAWDYGDDGTSFACKIAWDTPTAEVTEVKLTADKQQLHSWYCEGQGQQAVWQSLYASQLWGGAGSYGNGADTMTTSANQYYQYAYQNYIAASASAVYGINYSVDSLNYGEAARVKLTPEQLEAERLAVEKRQAERDAAKARAEELLLAVLSPAQQREYREFGYIDVNVDTRRYRIKNTGMSGNVKLIGQDGVEEASYCIHVRDTDMPLADNMLAQKLLLETDEPEFLKIANKTVLRIPTFPTEAPTAGELATELRRYNADQLHMVEQAITALERL